MEVKEILNRGLSLTVKEQLDSAEEVLGELELTLSLGEMWKQKTLDVSFSACSALGALSYSVAQVTAALSQLRFWTETNGYATSLTAKQVLTSWSGGSVLLMALIDALFMGLHHQAVFEWAVGDLIAEVHRLYPLE